MTYSSILMEAMTIVIEPVVRKVALCGDTTYVWRFSPARSYYT